MNKIYLSVNIEIKKEYLNEVLEEIKVLHAKTHELDKGCIQYDFFKIVDSENKFILQETWENMELLEEHKGKEHFKEFEKNVAQKIEKIELLILNKIL